MEIAIETEINPWKTIFFHPKETIEWVLENNPKQFYRKLYWFSALNILLLSLVTLSPDTGALKLNEPFILFLFLGFIYAILGSYVFIYFGTAVVNFIAGLFGGKAFFDTAKETLLWHSFPLGIIGIGFLAWRFLTRNCLHLDLQIINHTLHTAQLFYSTFIYANIYRALYDLSKTKGYLLACLGTVPALLMLILTAIMFPKL